MMKKQSIKRSVFIPILCVMLVFSCLLQASAASDQNGKEEKQLTSLFAAQQKDAKTELPQIKKLLDDYIHANSSEEKTVTGSQKHQVVAYDLDEAYRVHLTKNLMLSEYKENSGFDSMLSDTFRWYIPITTKDGTGLATCVYQDGKLILAGFSFSDSFMPKKAETIRAIAADKIITAPIQSIEYAYSDLYETVFILVKTNSDEYCMPYSPIINDLGLKNGFVYSVKELMKKLTKTFDENQMAESPDANGGLPYRSSKAPYIIIGSCTAVAAACIIIVSVRRKKRATAKGTEAAN